MNSIQTNYQALVIEENEVPHESVIFHVASEGGKSRWNHVGDLDSFFRRVYAYHQEHGFKCIMLKQFLQLVLFFLIYFGAIYASNCIWFRFDLPPSPYFNKTTISMLDPFIGVPTCAASLSAPYWILLVIGFIFTLYKCYRLWHMFYCYYDIKLFYNSAMKISDDNLINIVWHEVVCRLRDVQHEQQMCVHKSDLTELDIYHRILRHKNYMVAMMNKNILPVKYNIKFLGVQWVYISSGLLYNIELLLFNSYASPFKETGTLREDYKKYSKRKEVAKELSRNILILGLINLIFLPVIFAYQLLSSAFLYSGIVRYSPGMLSSRTWSLYARLYLRHFNELDHELHVRLSRAYKPSKEYMKSFASPIFEILAKFGSQVAGFSVMFFLVWSCFNERLIILNYFLLFTTLGTVVFVVLHACIPDEHETHYPSRLMHRIIGDIHYVPDHFKEKAHTTAVRDEFCQFFQYKFVAIFEELISSMVTPIILLFVLRHRSLDIVDFFRSFTVDVAGVGDVCSFALMDVSRHGNQHWLSENTKADQHQQAEDGKTELSLIHFTLMNPHWQPPPSSNMFINNFKEKVNIAKEHEYKPDDPYYVSLNSLSTMGSKYASLVNSLHQQPSASDSCFFPRTQAGSEKILGGKGVSHVEGPAYAVEGGIFSSLHADAGGADSNPMELRAADMSFSALYLHEAHHKLMESSKSLDDCHRQPSQEADNDDEESPLLEVRMQPGGGYVQ